MSLENVTVEMYPTKRCHSVSHAVEPPVQRFLGGFNLCWDEIISEVLGLDLSDLRYGLGCEYDAEISYTTFISCLSKHANADGNMTNLKTDITEQAFWCLHV